MFNKSKILPFELFTEVRETLTIRKLLIQNNPIFKFFNNSFLNVSVLTVSFKIKRNILILLYMMQKDLLSH